MKQGGKLAGGNPERGRVENDFYATHPDSVPEAFVTTPAAQLIAVPCVSELATVSDPAEVSVITLVNWLGEFMVVVCGTVAHRNAPSPEGIND